MLFVDDEPVVCEECGHLIKAPSHYILWEGATYCNEDCFKDALWRKFESDSETIQLRSAEDYESEYCDKKNED